ncbi:nicotinate-nucleotide--dimethylbenzimidazole phosphoribosyltransferase [Eilatimonas milleporae]|uniref:Nicotinate-nucleotide--dimethylbenzimidazole phosphoribosyltransferase n=1 Tax=Eilatimonas milleporae TaxID=911205 RepID=A0A3M0CIP1_9PROT|nr:nicotinate-nucleotide--dimethylbenzimidazole phosphoribosyltransferase [Eilatimonas milleporae]RMB08725.1 nicotinate-nucleotide-dimethylbenzimidazole phosphoribosyltransferase [Eilatimonas milleporae]
MRADGRIAFAGISEISDLAAGLTDRDADSAAVAMVRTRQSRLTKPQGSLGRLEDMAAFLAGWQRRAMPRLDTVQALVFAGNHGVCEQGISPYPQSVTAQMVDNFRRGGAAINQLCRIYGADLSVTALDLDRPTADFTQGPALDEAALLAAVNAGVGAVDPGADLVLLGEMGIGNSTVAAGLACALFGGDPADWVGPGTGLDGAGIARKTAVVAAALARHTRCVDTPADPLAILASLGGREQAALFGAVLAARLLSVPVLLDGFICCAAAAVLHALNPQGLDHALAGHCSAEPGHARLLACLDKEPLLDLGMRLGEGTGAAVALGLLRGALACHTGMATFADAGVDEAGVQT